MSEKEYIVTLHKDVDYEAFDAEMVSTTGSGAIPQRSPDVANARPASKRNTHYMLTDEEAEALRSDQRVMGVEIPPQDRDDIQIGFRATQVGNFTKTTLDSGDFINWGLRRCNESTDPYVGNIVTGGYDYTLDGTGVDVVIQDSGLQVDHPEFNDANGASRVQQIDWYTESGISGTQSANHYRDTDGHGTHCGGIAAGITYGWAKNARVYSVKVAGLEGAGDSNTGISTNDCFDVIKLWHRNKPVDPATGVKRPTVVNMSWGYGGYYRFNANSGHSITYRGTTYTGSDVDSSSEREGFGLPAESYTGGVGTGAYYRYNSRVPSVDADIEELVDEGVHVCIAAGNGYHKHDIVGGTDYNNSATCETYNFTLSLFQSGTFNYHQGSSPYYDGAFKVGNVDSTINAGGLDQKAVSSECGPAVNIYAPGTNIMSCTSTTNKFTDGAYPQDSNFRICNISGTSMASPQVCGLVALLAQLNPEKTPAEMLQFVFDNATNQLYTTGNDNDYSNNRSIMGSPQRFLFNKFNSGIQLTIGSS